MFKGKKRGDGSSQNKPRTHVKAKNAHPDRTEQRLRAQKEAIEAKLAAIERAKCPPTGQAPRTSHSSGVELEQDEEAEAAQKNYGDQRVAIKFFYEHFQSPPEEEWKGRYGTSNNNAMYLFST